MTKFAYCSDLHLGFGNLIIDNVNKSDCLILAGDIVELDDLNPELTFHMYTEFFKNVSKEFKTVIWVPGNHEFYGTSITEGTKKVLHFLQVLKLKNVHFAQNQTVMVNDIPVHCGTLWTDFKQSDPIVMTVIAQGLNDYVYIKDVSTGYNITASYILSEHKTTLSYLTNAIVSDCIVVTHHQPSLIACNSSRPQVLDYGYASDLSDFILDRPQIKYWIAGHTHISNEFNIGDTKLLVNCRGYVKHEPLATKFVLKYFEM